MRDFHQLLPYSPIIGVEFILTSQTQDPIIRLNNFDRCELKEPQHDLYCSPEFCKFTKGFQTAKSTKTAFNFVVKDRNTKSQKRSLPGLLKSRYHLHF